MVFMLEEYPQVRSSSTEVLDHPWVSVSTPVSFIQFRVQSLHTLQHVFSEESCLLGPVGGGTLLSLPPCPFTSSFPLFTFLFLSLALHIFFFCPSLPFLPE